MNSATDNWKTNFAPMQVFDAPVVDGCVSFESSKGSCAVPVPGGRGSASVAVYQDGSIDESVFEDAPVNLCGQYKCAGQRIAGRFSIHVKDGIVAVVVWRYGSDGQRLSYSPRNCFN